MKNKGFTLVELLAVIVVLSIIALIGYSTVGNIISSSQDSSNKITMKNYAKAVDQAVFLYEMNNSDSNLSELNSTWLKENVKFEKSTVECEYATYDKTSSLYGCKVKNNEKTYCYTNNEVTECNKNKLSKIYGNSIQNGTPTPTSPVEIESVGEKSTNLIPFNYTSKTIKGVTITVNSDGSLTYNGTATGGIQYELFNGKMPLVEGKKYYFSDCAVELNGTSGNYMSKGYTAKSGDYISLIWVYSISGTTFNNEIKRPMLSNSTITDSDYEHPGYKIPITVSNGTTTNTTNIYLKEPLRKIGDTADYLDLVNKKVVRNVKELILNGTENWTKYTTVNNHYQLIVGDNYFSRDTNSILSNYYIKATSGSYNSSLNYAVISADANRIRFKDKDISTIEDWKNKLVGYADNNKPLKVIYQLANETEENIEVPSIPELSEGQKCEDFYKVNGANIECGY